MLTVRLEAFLEAVFEVFLATSFALSHHQRRRRRGSITSAARSVKASAQGQGIDLGGRPDQEDPMSGDAERIGLHWDQVQHDVQTGRTPARTRWWESPTMRRHLNRLLHPDAGDGIDEGLTQRARLRLTERGLPPDRPLARAIPVGCGQGMNEMLLNYSDSAFDMASEKGISFSIEILNFIRLKIQKFQEETGNLYNLEATPAEGTTYRFAKEDKKRFPDIIQAGSGENIYYTNSSQLPVDYTDDPFDSLLKQDELQCMYTGGTVLHLYMNEKISSPPYCRMFLQKVLTNFKLPYVTVTPVFSVCPIHGYINGEQEVCPKCDEILLNELNNKISINEHNN